MNEVSLGLRSWYSAKADKAGFTLIELLIGIGISLVVMTIFAIAVKNATNTLKIEFERQAILDETRRGVDNVTLFGQGASAVLEDFTSDEPEVYATSENLIILESPAFDTNYDALEGLTDTIIFGRDPASSQNIVLKTFPAAGSRLDAESQTISTHLDEIIFRYFTPDGPDDDLADELITDSAEFDTATRFEIELTTLSQKSDQDVRVTLTGGAKLRNKE